MLKKRFNNKDQQKDDQYKDLLVFGYSSKLFRDDEKALEIDRGRHLIPWMGDESLLIDRYDGRGYLDDVKLFASDNKFEMMMMTEEEKAREKELDEERYMDLYVDVEQKLMNEEEEMKRSKEAETKYGAVNFQYEEGGDGNDDDDTKQDQDVKAEEVAEEFEPYVKVEGLNVPEGMEMPHTMKHHKIIAKTALFISKQTLQMEILVKTRQKDNPAFCFLNFDDRLYPYYKHLLSEIKQGRYVPTVEQDDAKPEAKKEEEQKHVEVHISSQDFLKSVEEKLPPRLVKDTCYDKLLNNLRKHIPVQPPTPPAPPSPPKIEEVVQPVRQQPQIEIPVAVPEFIVPPPPDKKFLIDKMAAYVAKNGPDFETVVRMKNDLRFDFITEGHVWHNYYKMRRTMLEQEAREAQISEPVQKEAETKATELKSISFSIKNKEVVPDKVVVQNVLSEDAGVIGRTYGDNGLGQMNSFNCGPPAQVQPVVPWGYQPPVQVVTSFTPKPPLTNGHATTKRKRFHSPPPEACNNKKSKSPECAPNPPENVPKLQQSVYGLKTNLTVYEPKPPSPVYGPELPPKEFLEKLASQRLTVEAKLPPPEGNVGLSGLKASLSNGSRGASRESMRRRSTSRDRRRSKSRDRKRSRSRGRYRSRSRDRRRSVSRRRSRSRSEKKLRKRSRSSDRRRDRLEKKNKNSRSMSRSERTHKKSKHHKKHKHHKRVDGSGRTVVLDLTNEDVVDLTED